MSLRCDTCGLVRGHGEPRYQPIHRQRDADGLRNLETNRPHLQYDAGADADRALNPMRLRVIDANNVTRPQVTGFDVLDRHVPTVGGQHGEGLQHRQRASRLTPPATPLTRLVPPSLACLALMHRDLGLVSVA
jgi:hypothetical protein